MELFCELYGCYYAAVGKVLHEAHGRGLTRMDIQAIVDAEAFSESGLHLLPRLLNGDWHLLTQDEHEAYHSNLQHADTGMPVTTLQKSWLKALLADPRMRLFLSSTQQAACAHWLRDVTPLWSADDLHTFDEALDHDPYEDAAYQEHFQLLLYALKKREALEVTYAKPKGGILHLHFVPTQFQYSAKDGKFRVIGRSLRPDGKTSAHLLNVGRVLTLRPSAMRPPVWLQPGDVPQRNLRSGEILLYIWPERNALERCMTQFAFYEKETWADKEGRGHFCKLRYPMDDESELLIRVLSFGPVIRVLGPEGFVRQIRERIQRQTQWLDGGDGCAEGMKV